ncbi:dihydrodipicolinate synthase family protein [Pullulanibacillus sp. KACC 23026]|uniref:dihydrodipicolinate synthase family protein n=1 Tax=Pullulanibacillus sp. KACC 23026 TaxID=3028315 RepID=UPI0023AFA8F3|nr:dihydrodipicolinate synthase family protein [Pullulanibacillus sp. KACC 23026]WEG11117.1 dihydrodipicolinate synthase family protein [Pullulanibacillus sp. KACC 23026]
MKTVNLEGIIATTITPFDPNENIDEQAFVEQVRYLVSTGVDGISVGGSTGEGSVLTDEELGCLCQLAVKEVDGRIPVVAGVIRNSTREAIRTAEVAKAAGVDALMVTPVIYFVNRPSDAGNFEFYQRIGEKLDLPIVIYNVVPHNSVSPGLLKQLVEIPQVVAIKQSGGDIHALAQMISECGDRILVSSAVDDLLYPTYAIGARGSIVAPSAIVPELIVKQWQAFKKGDFATAEAVHQQLLPVYLAIQGPNFQGKIKEAIRQLGRTAGITRSPIQAPTADEKEYIAQMLKKANVL